MINWKIPSKTKQAIITGNKIKIGNSSIVFTKESLKMVIGRFSNGKGIMIGIKDSILYLKDDKKGYKVNKHSSNYYNIMVSMPIIELLLEHGIKKGIYDLESNGDGVFRCKFIEEI